MYVCERQRVPGGTRDSGVPLYLTRNWGVVVVAVGEEWV